jgi:hypothetical protein
MSNLRPANGGGLQTDSPRSRGLHRPDSGAEMPKASNTGSTRSPSFRSTGPMIADAAAHVAAATRLGRIIGLSPRAAVAFARPGGHPPRGGCTSPGSLPPFGAR